jgi:hypothetical protein
MPSCRSEWSDGGVPGGKRGAGASTISQQSGGFLMQAAVGIERFMVFGGSDRGWGLTESGRWAFEPVRVRTAPE